MDKDLKLNIRWSKSVKLITCISSVTIILGSMIIAFALWKEGFNWIGVLVFFIMIFVYIGSIIIAPKYILINDEYIIIKKIIGSKKISRLELSDVYPLIDDSYNIRLFGSGGLFGYIGLFMSKKEGRYISYAGDYKQAFFLLLKNKKKYLISSENRDYIILLLKNQINDEKKQ